MDSATRAAVDVLCLHDTEDRIVEQRKTIAKLQQELAAKDVQLAAKDAVIAGKNGTIGAKNVQIRAKDVQIRDLREEVRALNVQIAGCSRCGGQANGSWDSYCEDCFFDLERIERELLQRHRRV